MNKLSNLFIRCPVYSQEWQEVKKYRQSNFFDKVSIDDPYTWTFDHPDHHHYLLYQEDKILGYAHIQFCPSKRAALRIIVVDERGQGLGGQFLNLIEQGIKKLGIDILHIESSPSALRFYRKHEYKDMPFNDPDHHESDPQDTPIAKVL